MHDSTFGQLAEELENIARIRDIEITNKINEGKTLLHTLHSVVESRLNPEEEEMD